MLVGADTQARAPRRHARTDASTSSAQPYYRRSHLAPVFFALFLSIGAWRA